MTYTREPGLGSPSHGHDTFDIVKLAIGTILTLPWHSVAANFAAATFEAGYVEE
jgi:hypothetical protein